jgi:hypothetical protein
MLQAEASADHCRAHRPSAGPFGQTAVGELSLAPPTWRFISFFDHSLSLVINPPSDG